MHQHCWLEATIQIRDTGEGTTKWVPMNDPVLHDLNLVWSSAAAPEAPR